MERKVYKRKWTARLYRMDEEAHGGPKRTEEKASIRRGSTPLRQSVIRSHSSCDLVASCKDIATRAVSSNNVFRVSGRGSMIALFVEGAAS